MRSTPRDVLKASAAASALAALGLPPRDLRSEGGESVSGGVVAGVLIETVPGAASRVAARLLGNGRVEVQGGDGDRRIAAVLTADSGLDLEVLTEQLLHEDADVLVVHATYVAENPPGGLLPTQEEVTE